VYLQNLKNDMALAPAVISGHSHDGSTANDKGGAFYYLEESTTMAATIKFVPTDPTFTSYYGNINVLNNHGGFLYAAVKNSLTVMIDNAKIENNIAKLHGGIFAFEDSGAYSVVIDRSTINDTIA
jgi:hypothetical protein